MGVINLPHQANVMKQPTRILGSYPWHVRLFNQIKVNLSRALNTTGVVDLTVKCLLKGSNQ